MHWQYTPFAAILFITATVSAVLGLIAWRRRPGPDALPFTVLMLAVAEWSLAYSLELASVELPAKLFWTNAQYLGVAVIPGAWLVLAVQHTGLGRWLTRRNLALLAVEPLAMLLLVWTNDRHGLIRSGVGLDTRGPIPTLESTFEIGFWINAGYSYLLLFLGSLLLFTAFLRSPPPYRRQMASLLIGALMPWVGNALTITDLGPWPYLDLTPFAFTGAGLAVAGALFRFQWLDLVPVARDAVIEGMRDGVIVLDALDRVVDLNPAAQRILGLGTTEAVGQPVSRLLAAWPAHFDLHPETGEAHVEFTLGDVEPQRRYDLRISSLHDRRGRLTGRLAIVRDVTQQKSAQEAQREGQARLRRMAEQMPAVLWTTDTELRFTSSVGAGLAALRLHTDEVVGMSLFEYFQTDDADFLPIAAHRRALAGESATYETEWADNAYQTSVEPLRGADDEIVGCIGLALDITERKRADRALRRRDAILQAVSFAAEEFLKVAGWEQGVQEALGRLGQATEVSRIYVFENQTAGDGTLLTSQRFEWVGPGITPQIDNPDLQGFPWEAAGFGRWVDELSAGRTIHGHVKDFPDSEREVLAAQDIQSILIVPISVGGEWWGFIGFDECVAEREWSLAEIDALRAAAGTLGAAIQNSRVEAERRAREQFVELLNDITRAAIEKSDFQAVLQALADRLGELIGADACYVTLWDEARQMVIPAAASGPMRDTYRAVRIEPGEVTMTESVLRAGHPLVVEDVFDTPYLSPRIAGQFPERCKLGLPLIADDQKLGAALVSFSRPRQFTQEEIERCAQAAGQAALAIAKARLLEVAQRRAEEAETLRQAGAAVTATLHPEEAIERILEQLERVVPFASASVQLLREGYVEIVGGRGWTAPEGVVGLRFPVPADNPNTVVIQERRPYILGDAPAAHAPFRDEPHSHIRSWLGVPLLVQDRVIGMLAVDSREPNHFAPEHARLVAAFADQVAIALENARLFESQRRRSQELETLREASLRLTSSLDLPPILEAVLVHALRLVASDNAHIFLFDGERLSFGAALWADGDRETPYSQPRSGGLTHAVAVSGERIVIPDVNSHSLFQDWRWGGAIAGLPLRIGDQVVGVMNVAFDVPHDFTPDELRLLELLADQAAMAIRNAQLHAEVQELAITDSLTGLYNRRGFFELGRREVERARRFGRPLTAIMFDLDHFKRVNDAYGHRIGDQVLAGLARRCRTQLRDVDLLGRYGGEEFSLLLPESGGVFGRAVAERLRLEVERAKLPTERGPQGTTISLGVASLDARCHDLEALLERADQALYAAKRSGRNRVETWHG